MGRVGKTGIQRCGGNIFPFHQPEVGKIQLTENQIIGNRHARFLVEQMGKTALRHAEVTGNGCHRHVAADVLVNVNICLPDALVARRLQAVGSQCSVCPLRISGNLPVIGKSQLF